MISATFTSVPLGMPAAHAEACAVPRATFTRVMMLGTVTVREPSQSPTQAIGVRVAVGDGLAVIADVAVTVRVVVGEGVAVSMPVAVAVGLFAGGAVSVGLLVAVGVAVRGAVTVEVAERVGVRVGVDVGV